MRVFIFYNFFFNFRKNYELFFFLSFEKDKIKMEDITNLLKINSRMYFGYDVNY